MKNYEVTIEFQAASDKEAIKIKETIRWMLWDHYPWSSKSPLSIRINCPESLNDT